MRRALRIVGVVFAVLIALGLLRWGLEPDAPRPLQVSISTEALARLRG